MPGLSSHLNTSQVRASPARLGALVSREATTSSSCRGPLRLPDVASSAAASSSSAPSRLPPSSAGVPRAAAQAPAHAGPPPPPFFCQLLVLALAHC